MSTIHALILADALGSLLTSGSIFLALKLRRTPAPTIPLAPWHLTITGPIAKEIADGRMIPLGLLVYQVETDELTMKPVGSRPIEETQALLSKFHVSTEVR